MIPKIIHQTWKTKQIPEHFRLLKETWIKLHPDWTYILWTDEDNRRFIQNHFPSFLEKFDSYPTNIQRVDAIRYFILYTMGGLYVDIDYECLQSVQSLLENKSAVFGSEPAGHCMRFNMDMIVSNAFMACKKKDPFFELLCRSMEDTIQQDTKTITSVLETTGPFKLSKLVAENRASFDISIIEPSVICPLTIEEVQATINGNITSDVREKLDTAFAVHYFWGNWWSEIV
ncbi:glycosyltransferase [Pedobacter sp. JY14-1]|uniref:glycosyltransferase family 32 protein n=1 Tax=Pedobacter sp. JY14-1 TaxID=3034151 RepID=UPI0023E0FB01|nr:glycosyltransferase [Pedobacter sp. JY14-1]